MSGECQCLPKADDILIRVVGSTQHLPKKSGHESLARTLQLHATHGAATFALVFQNVLQVRSALRTARVVHVDGIAHVL